jgi:vacuolar-type H+-ATPase subunit I/STV1
MWKRISLTKKISLIEKIKKLDHENILFFSILFGVLLLSAGVYVMGSGINRSLGSYMIILGSGIFYVSVIIFTLRLK